MNVQPPSGAVYQHRHLPNCPKCKKEFDTRIPRNAVIRLLLPWVPLKHYACHRCGITKYKLA